MVILTKPIRDYLFIEVPFDEIHFLRVKDPRQMFDAKPIYVIEKQNYTTHITKEKITIETFTGNCGMRAFTGWFDRDCNYSLLFWKYVENFVLHVLRSGVLVGSHNGEGCSSIYGKIPGIVFGPKMENVNYPWSNDYYKNHNIQICWKVIDKKDHPDNLWKVV